MARRTSPWVEAVIRVLLTLLLAWGLVAVLRSMDYRWNWAVFWNARHEYLRGLQMTLFLSLCAMALALVLGSIAALGRLSRQIVLRHLADVYVEVVRGTPLLAQIFIMWYGVFFLIRQKTEGLAPGWWTEVVGGLSRMAGALSLPTAPGLFEERVQAGIVIMALFAGAYIAETIRAGIQSIDPGQREAGLAVGMTPSQVMRVIVFPQAFRRILPPLTGELIALIKDSSLLQIIGIAELTKKAYELNARSFKPFEAFLPLAVIYFALTWPLSLLSQALERRYGGR